LGQPKIFPASAGAGTFGEFQVLGSFFCWRKHHGGFGVIFCEPLGFRLKAGKKIPPKLWRLSKIFGVVVYFKKGPDFDFQTPKLGCSSKTLQVVHHNLQPKIQQNLKAEKV